MKHIKRLIFDETHDDNYVHASLPSDADILETITKTVDGKPVTEVWYVTEHKYGDDEVTIDMLEMSQKIDAIYAVMIAIAQKYGESHAEDLDGAPEGMENTTSVLEDDE